MILRIINLSVEAIIFIPTFQPASFGRVYAAYGGIFIVLSIFWGWQIDRMPQIKCRQIYEKWLNG